MRRYTWTAALLALIIVTAGCTRTVEEVTIERHHLDTEFIVE